MDHAKRAAAGVVARLAPGADAIVIEAGRDARVVAPLDGDPRRLEAAVARLEARAVEGQLSAALALAADRLRSLAGRRRVVLITDGALADDTPLVVAGIPTEIISVGDDEDNAAIVRADVRSGVDAATHREQAQVFAMVQSFAAKPREAYVTVSLEGAAEPLASRRLLLAPGDRAPVVLTFEPRAEDHGAGLVVQLSPGDANPLDDIAFGRVPASLHTPVTVVSDAAYSWTTRAIESDPDVDLQRISSRELASVNVDPDALVVVEGACPPSLPGRDALIVAPPQGACLGVDVGAEVKDPPVTSWEPNDPRLRFLTFDGVHVARARALDARGAGAGLVRSATTALVADASTPGRTATILGFDPGASDWPLKASFVVFVRNLVEMSRAHRAQGAVESARTGGPARVVVPAGATRVFVAGPGLPEREIAARQGLAIVPPLDQAGLYRVRWSEPHVGSSLFAVNLTSARESDVRPRPVTVSDAPGSAATAHDETTGVAYGQWVSWLALLAAIAIAFDVYWTTRRPRARAGALR
jgi:hypothetical protein